jgi:hypothetical protein
MPVNATTRARIRTTRLSIKPYPQKIFIQKDHPQKILK